MKANIYSIEVGGKLQFKTNNIIYIKTYFYNFDDLMMLNKSFVSYVQKTSLFWGMILIIPDILYLVFVQTITMKHELAVCALIEIILQGSVMFGHELFACEKQIYQQAKPLILTLNWSMSCFTMFLLIISCLHEYISVVYCVCIIICKFLLTSIYHLTGFDEQQFEHHHLQRPHIPVFNYVETEQYLREVILISDTPTCSICLNECLNTENLRCMQRCQHVFHERCIETWLRSGNGCPMCRRE